AIATPIITACACPSIVHMRNYFLQRLLHWWCWQVAAQVFYLVALQHATVGNFVQQDVCSASVCIGSHYFVSFIFRFIRPRRWRPALLPVAAAMRPGVPAAGACALLRSAARTGAAPGWLPLRSRLRPPLLLPAAPPRQRSAPQLTGG